MVPPGTSKDENTRYLDIHEGDPLDEAQVSTWVKQAAALPGWVVGLRASAGVDEPRLAPLGMTGVRGNTPDFHPSH